MRAGKEKGRLDNGRQSTTFWRSQPHVSQHSKVAVLHTNSRRFYKEGEDRSSKVLNTKKCKMSEELAVPNCLTLSITLKYMHLLIHTNP